MLNDSDLEFKLSIRGQAWEDKVVLLNVKIVCPTCE